MVIALGRTVVLGSEGTVDIHLFQIVGLADFLVRVEVRSPRRLRRSSSRRLLRMQSAMPYP